MTTLVVCLDRNDDVGRKTGLRTPIVGWEAVRALVTDVGLADPEDSGVNSLLETLRVAQTLRDDDEDPVVAVVSGDRESMVSADRAVANQLDELIADHDPDSAVVVIDSAEDERLVPIVESRVQIDSVDRVVVRQARDIESTYYLLKQFLADEQLRSTILVPFGVALLLLPALFYWFSAGTALAGVAGLLGATLLYKGLAIDRFVAGMPERIREALYAGQVSVVTYVVAGGLALVGGFFGVLSASDLGAGAPRIVEVMEFIYAAVPWFAVAGVTAAVGRLLDELIRDEGIRTPYLNLPFVIVAVAFVVRGFAGYFLAQEAILDPFVVMGVTVSPGERLAAFIVLGVAISLVGVKLASDVGTETLEEVIDAERETGKK